MSKRPGWPNSQLRIRNLLLYHAQTWWLSVFIRKTHSDQTVSNWKTFSLCVVAFTLLIIMELSFVIHKIDSQNVWENSLIHNRMKCFIIPQLWIIQILNFHLRKILSTGLHLHRLFTNATFVQCSLGTLLIVLKCLQKQVGCVPHYSWLSLFGAWCPSTTGVRFVKLIRPFWYNQNQTNFCYSSLIN